MQNSQKNQGIKPENFSILIVDDEQANRDLLCKRLQNEGYHTNQAIDGIEATELLSIERFDIILLDLNMPRMGGFEFLEWLNENDPEHDIYVITLSGESNRDTVVTALTMGAKDYIIKSASVLELLNRIRRACLTRYLQSERVEGLDTAKFKDAQVMVVDDEQLNLLLVKKHLNKAGFKVQCFENGPSMLESIRKEPVDLLLLDIRMPDMDGVEVLRTVRSEFAPEQLAIIMLTGVESSKQTDECYQLGADDYITKPFSGIELISRVNAALQLKVLRSQNKNLEILSNLGDQIRTN
jgi:DNA-binding response OmpR family regulator